MLRSAALFAFFIHLTPSMVQKQMIAHFIDVVFHNNTSMFRRAFFVHVSRVQIYKTKLNMIFIWCQFTGNQARYGGAICVTDYSDFLERPCGKQVYRTIYFLHCVFKNNKATRHAHANKLTMKGGGRGAVFCYNFAVYISDTTMVNNYATSHGGSLYDESCIIHFVKSTIRIDKRMPQLTLFGQAICSRGKLIMKEVRIDMKNPILKGTKIPYIWMTGTEYGAHIIPHAIPQRVNLACSTGNGIALQISQIMPGTQFSNGTSVRSRTVFNKKQFLCYPCHKTLYSLAFGRATLLNTSSMKLYNIKCHHCPYGGQ